ncbi:MAG: lysophospholipid acyltransferase family protein [Candidatus Babeliales bacterium]
MNKVWLFFRSLVGYMIVGIVFLICSIPCFIIACLPAKWRYDNKVYYWFLNIFYKGIVWATFLPITIEGKENIPDKAAIIVANHQSSLDIPLLGSLVNSYPHIWLFLARFAKIPFFGFIVRRMNVVVDHSGLRRLISSLDTAFKIIQKHKSHVMIFPEGGRYIDNKIHKFLHGFAILAKKTGRPVVPVFMFGVNKVYPPGSFFVRPHPIHIIVGRSFTFEPDEQEDDFVERVYNWFKQREQGLK